MERTLSGNSLLIDKMQGHCGVSHGALKNVDRRFANYEASVWSVVIQLWFLVTVVGVTGILISCAIFNWKYKYLLIIE